MSKWILDLGGSFDASAAQRIHCQISALSSDKGSPLAIIAVEQI
jgi:hypothetical protein